MPASPQKRVDSVGLVGAVEIEIVGTSSHMSGNPTYQDLGVIHSLDWRF
jgi:hypothetical protein